MTLIVRKPNGTDFDSVEYDVVDGDAEIVQVDANGGLLIRRSVHTDGVIAAYPAGQWRAVWRAGEVRQGSDDKIYDALVKADIIKE